MRARRRTPRARSEEHDRRDSRRSHRRAPRPPTGPASEPNISVRRVRAGCSPAQRACIVRPVVAAPMVVLDLQIAVKQQALRDHEIVRFVTARHRAPPPTRRREEAKASRPGHEPGCREWGADERPVKRSEARTTVAPARRASRRARRPTRSAGGSAGPDQEQRGTARGSQGRKINESSETGTSGHAARAITSARHSCADGIAMSPRRDRQDPNPWAVEAGMRASLARARQRGHERLRPRANQDGSCGCWSFYKRS